MLILHFIHNLQVNAYVKKLYFHRGCLWFDRPYLVDVKLISSITGLPKTGIDLMPYLHQNMDTFKMKQKYKLPRIGRVFLIGPIEDNRVRFPAKILSYKLLCKMRPTECITSIVELAK